VDNDKKLLIAALVVLFGGNASSIVGGFIPIRADAFTLTDFQEEKALMIEYITAVDQKDEQDMDILRHRITTLEEKTKECRRRIEDCENQ